MIGLLAVRELDGDFPDGSVITELFVHRSLLDDEPLIRAVKLQSIAQLLEYSPDVVAGDACTYVFAPAYLDGVLDRHRRSTNPARADDRLHPDLGAVCAVWWKP